MVSTNYQLHPTQTGKVLLQNISWSTYTRLRDDIGDAPTRLTYDRGLLEIEVPSQLHEELKRFVGQLIETAVTEAGADFKPVSSTTWWNEELDRGAEADESYYIQNYAAVRDKQRIDLSSDPPPDLVVEIDLTGSVIDKLDIYASLKVPEVWWVQPGRNAEILRLDRTGSYNPVERSEALPVFTPSVIDEYLRQRESLGHAGAVRHFKSAVLGK